MKRWIALLGLGLMSAASVGCTTPPWSPSSAIRTEQLILYSEQIRMSGQDLTRLLLLDQQSALNPVRLNGAVGP